MDPLRIETDDQRIEILRRIRDRNKAYIWGSGSYRKTIEEYLRMAGGYSGQIVIVVDDEYYLSGQMDVIPFSTYIESCDHNAPLIFGFYNYPVILEKRKQWSSVIPNMYDFHLAVVNGKRLLWDPDLAKSREAEYARTYRVLSDERSRRIMQLYLNAATAGQFRELFTECFEEKAYFNRITDGLKIDTLIDCGAYDGDSIHDFVSVFPEYDQIIAVEPDPVNVQKLTERVDLEKICNVKVVKKGVGASNKTLSFHASGESNSYIGESGDSMIQITTLDDAASGTIGNIFVKMDIEGAELDALHGARELLRERHPALAICVYHKEEDLITIPQFVQEIVGDGVYDYYLGFHGLDLAELVFYAVPKR